MRVLILLFLLLLSVSWIQLIIFSARVMDAAELEGRLFIAGDPKVLL